MISYVRRCSFLKSTISASVASIRLRSSRKYCSSSRRSTCSSSDCILAVISLTFRSPIFSFFASSFWAFAAAARSFRHCTPSFPSACSFLAAAATSRSLSSHYLASGPHAYKFSIYVCRNPF
eukprot:SAG22_NODE_824_length_6981_cov_2.752833_1_plen_122_part_00